MTNSIAVDEWVDALDSEYLSGFIKDGGATVKFAVADDDGRRALGEALKRRCEASGYVFVALDAVDIRVYMPQDIFFGLALRIDWRLVARRRVLNLLAEMGFRVDGVDPANAAGFVKAVTDANGIEAPTVLLQLRPALERDIFKNRNMTKAFRVAMMHLCLGEMTPGSSEHYSGQAVLDWLTGADAKIGKLKPFQIHTRINRTTARHFIESAFYWVRQAGYAGAVLVLDNARVLLPRNPKDGVRFYTRAMTMDHYELLREFIDGVDRLSGAVAVVATGQDFVDDGASKGWKLYSALRTRVMDDVRDRDLVNPVAALVRLS